MIKWLTDRFKRTCKHVWNDYSYGKRVCIKCYRYEMLVENRYPLVGQLKYEWKYYG